MSENAKQLPVFSLVELARIPKTYASPSILLKQANSAAVPASSAQQPREISEVPVINKLPNLWGEEFQPLQKVTRPTFPTAQAAYYLNRKPQTLRSWASLENGPIRPIRVNGRLAWSVAEIRVLLKGGI